MMDLILRYEAYLHGLERSSIELVAFLDSHNIFTAIRIGNLSKLHSFLLFRISYSLIHS